MQDIKAFQLKRRPVHPDAMTSTSLADIGSLKFNPSAEFGTKQYSFVNMNPHYSATGMPPTSSSSSLSNTRCQAALQSKRHTSSRVHKRARRHSLKPLLVPSLDHLPEHDDVALSANAIGSYHSHSFGISVETSPIATCLATSEQRHRDLSDPLASVGSFNGEPFMRHGPMGWSQGNCFILSPEQNSSDYLDLKPLPTVPIEMDTADNIRFSQPAFDIYGFSTNDETWVNTIQVSTFIM